MSDLTLLEQRDTWVKSDRQRDHEERDRRKRLRDRSLAGASMVVALLVVGAVTVTSPGWPAVRSTFFDLDAAADALPQVLDGFTLNLTMIVIAEPIILVLGLLVALARGFSAPLLFPLRALAVVYVDLFRGVPSILVILLIGYGVPALQLQGVPTDPVVLGLTALVLSYTAYVAEVFRAGIDSVHPSQRNSALSIGLTDAQSLRFVVLPQAVRRVVPPLLNDFVSLQKDTALVSVLGPLEALRQAQIFGSSTFNYSAYLVAAALFLALTVPITRFTDHLARRTATRRGQGHAA